MLVAIVIPRPKLLWTPRPFQNIFAILKSLAARPFRNILRVFARSGSCLIASTHYVAVAVRLFNQNRSQFLDIVITNVTVVVLDLPNVFICLNIYVTPANNTIVSSATEDFRNCFA